MLRESSKATGLGLELAIVASDAAPPFEHGEFFAELAEAITTGSDQRIDQAREALVATAGPAATERAIGVAATFQMMNRLLDGVGTPPNQRLAPIAAELGFTPEDITR